MAEAKAKDPQRVTFGGRLSFPKLWKAAAYKDQEPKFSCTLLIDKDADLAPIKKAVFAAKVRTWGKDKEKWPKGMRPSIHDGDEKADLDGYKGKFYIVAKNKHKPKVVDRQLNEVTEEMDKIYAGCFVEVALRAFTYGGPGTGMKPGVTFSLEAVKFKKDGPRFSGLGDVSEVFEKEEDDSDDESNYEESESDDESDDESEGW